MYFAASFLLKPIFLHLLSASLHLVFLVAFFVSWVRKKITAGAIDGSEEKLKSTLYSRTLFCSLGASAFNLVMCLLYCFYWYRNGWSDEKVLTLSDLALKTVAWGVVFASLRTGFFNSGERRFLLFFRAWCAFYLIISCYCFIVDIILHLKHFSLPLEYSVSDGVSSFVGVFFCYVVFSMKNESEDSILQVPLLNNNTDVSNALEINKTKGDDIVTPYSNAGIFSIFTFSWVCPLIVAGKQKTLHLEDVPQLASCDSVTGAFPPFRNKLEAVCGTINRVTTLELAKSLILSAGKEIFATAILELVNTLASYVGPYLINTFVQYLNGKQTFKNEGYVLVAAFFVAKLIECLS